MSVRKYLETAALHSIIRYDTHPDLEKECISFTGAPRKHPYDKDKILLLTEPLTANMVFYEFTITDILHVEDLSSIVTEHGEVFAMAQIWVKRGSIGMKFEPFEVDNPLHFPKDKDFYRHVMAEKR